MISLVVFGRWWVAMHCSAFMVCGMPCVAVCGLVQAERYALLVLANLSVTKENHKAIMDAGLDLLVGMAKSPDLRCRQHAIFALGNLASQPANGDMIVEGGCVKPIISFAFPGDLNVQFQAVAALRGLSMQSHIRLQIVRAGALEPLILAAGSDSVEVQREVAATLANLTMVRCGWGVWSRTLMVWPAAGDVGVCMCVFVRLSLFCVLSFVRHLSWRVTGVRVLCTGGGEQGCRRPLRLPACAGVAGPVRRP